MKRYPFKIINQDYSFTIDIQLDKDKDRELIETLSNSNCVDKDYKLSVAITQCNHCPYIKRYYGDGTNYKLQCLKLVRYIIGNGDIIDPRCPYRKRCE